MPCCGKAGRGVVGLTKAAIGIDKTPSDVVLLRRAVCEVCERAEVRRLGGVAVLRLCAACSCFILPKTAIRSETCPEGKWGKI